MDALQTAMLRSRLTPRRANTLEELTRCRALVDGLKKNPVDAPALPPSPPIADEIKRILDRLAEIEVRLHQLSHPSQISQAAEIDEPEPKRITVAQIKRVVSRHYDVTINDINAKRQDHRSVTPRHVAIYLATRLTLLSRPVIGHQFGGRDHTTVMHAEKKIAMKRERDQVFAAELAELERVLGQP